MREEKSIIHKMIDVETTMYIAYDGTKFSDADICRKYEEDLKRLEPLKSIETCEHLETFPPFDDYEHPSESKYFWYRPKSEEEIKILNEFYPFADEIPFHYAGKWICIEVSRDDSGAWYTPLDTCINYANRILIKLGYEMKITERR